MNSTEVQHPRHKLDDKCLCLLYVFGSVLACAKSAHMFQKLSYSLCGLSLQLITLPQTVRLFYVSLHSQAPQQQSPSIACSCTMVLHCGHTFLNCLWKTVTNV